MSPKRRAKKWLQLVFDGIVGIFGGAVETKGPGTGVRGVPADVRGERINSKRIYQLAAAMVTGAVVLNVMQILLFGFFARARPGSREVVLSKPNMPIEIDSGVPLAELRQREERNLNRLEWVDRGAGLVRIPIERAMEIFVSRSGGGGRAK